MPWEITIKHPDGLPLGSPQVVSDHIRGAFPGVQFYREPSGAEKLASLPPGIELPDVIRQHWEQSAPQRHADFEASGYSLRFYLGNEGTEVLETVDIEARGRSRPAMPMMEALTLATGWIIVDAWGNTIVQQGQSLPEAK